MNLFFYNYITALEVKMTTLEESKKESKEKNFVDNIGADGWMSEGRGFVNVFKKTHFTDLIIIANDSRGISADTTEEDAGVFHISLFMLTHYSGHWCKHFADIGRSTSDEFVLHLDYPAWIVSAWLDAWHPASGCMIDAHFEEIEHLMPIYFKYDMQEQLLQCYGHFTQLAAYTPGIIKLIFNTEHFKHLDKYFVDNILMNQHITIPIEWLKLIPMEIIANVWQMKNSMICSLNQP